MKRIKAVREGRRKVRQIEHKILFYRGKRESGEKWEGDEKAEYIEVGKREGTRTLKLATSGTFTFRIS